MRVILFALFLITVAPKQATAAQDDCYAENCEVFVEISVKRRVLNVYENGILVTRATVKPPRLMMQHRDRARMNKNFTGRTHAKDYIHISRTTAISAPRPYATFIDPIFYIYGDDNVTQKSVSGFGYRTTMDAAETIRNLVRMYGPKNSWISVGY